MDDKIFQAVDVLNNGGIVIFPTDTAFGIGCRIDNEKAVKKVFEIKHRSLDNALLVLVDSVELAEKYVQIPDEVRTKLVDKYWPGGLSIFFKTKPGKVARIVTANTDVLAIRWPKHEQIVKVVNGVGVPIIATSANISGGVTPYSLEQVDATIIRQADYVMEGECTYKKESTIVDTTVKPWKILRIGVVELNSNFQSRQGGTSFSIFKKKSNVILYIDTADREIARIKLTVNEKKYECKSSRSEQKSQVALQMIDTVIKKAGISISDIDTIEVNRGPGSFTGLRVGIAIANAMSFATLEKVNNKDLGEIEEPIYTSNS